MGEATPHNSTISGHQITTLDIPGNVAAAADPPPPHGPQHKRQSHQQRRAVCKVTGNFEPSFTTTSVKFGDDVTPPLIDS